jgi:hypothetical protein
LPTLSDWHCIAEWRHFRALSKRHHRIVAIHFCENRPLRRFRHPDIVGKGLPTYNSH